MKKMYKRLINIITISVLVFAFNIVAFAQGTTMITVSKSSAAVGDSVTVTVSGTESGSITVKYTSSMLTFSSCSVSGYSAEGNSVTFSGKEGDIVFSATAPGTASIIVSSTANSGSSTTLTIGGTAAGAANDTAAETNTETDTQEAASADTATETEIETTETTEDTTAATTTSTQAGVAGTLNSDGGFDINGTAYVVSERYSDSEMPSGFSKTTIKIGSSTYSEPTNGTITLLYLKPADNTAGSGVFYLYDEVAGTVSEFLMLGSKDNYVIISTPASAPSAAFTATSIDVTGGTAIAYTVEGSEFFYLYGTNTDGVTGWYVYDKTYDTISRMDESALTATGSVDTDDGEDDSSVTNTDNSIYIEKLNLYRKIIMGLIILCVVLLFVLINKAIKGHGDDDDDFDGDVFAKAPVKSARRLPRSIVFNSRDNDEDEDEYEDEEEYYEDDEYYDDDLEDDADVSRARYESESYEARRASSLNMMDLNDL